MDDFSMNRRHFLTVTGASALALAFVGMEKAWASDAASGVTPDEALKRLIDGHTRFVAGQSQHPRADLARILETAKNGQHPFATFISCADSRVPVETIFDQGIGDLFVIRVAGNVADTDEIGTAEYGSGHLGVPLIVVLGHTKCGAVTAVVKGDQVGGSIPKLVDNIIPAVARAKEQGKSGDELINLAIKENVRQSMSDLIKNSAELAHLEHAGKVRVVGAVYHIEDGSLEWLA